MLSELTELQESDENIWGVDMSFEIETRSEEGDELVHKEYIFSYAKEWDKWAFTEYKEKRTENTDRIGDRNWRDGRHIMWHDINATPSIDIPPEVSSALQQATGADTVTIQR